MISADFDYVRARSLREALNAIALKDGVVYVASAGSPTANYGDGTILRITIHP